MSKVIFIENHLRIPAWGHFMWKYFSNLFLALFEGHSIRNSKKNFKIWKLEEKIFSGKIPKWWVKRSLGSFVKKILLEAWAEKLRLKIFLEASFPRTKAFLKPQKVHCERISRNWKSRWCLKDTESKVGLHNVSLDFSFDDFFT